MDVILVGHCGPDTSFLKLAVLDALPGARIRNMDDEAELFSAIRAGRALLLINRVLEDGFSTTEGVELIRRVRQQSPDTPCMLISNFAEAQQAAVNAGALPGFGKQEIGKPHVLDRLRAAASSEVTSR
jgi:CheY-like chemotaxis protein